MINLKPVAMEVIYYHSKQVKLGKVEAEYEDIITGCREPNCKTNLDNFRGYMCLLGV